MTRWQWVTGCSTSITLQREFIGGHFRQSGASAQGDTEMNIYGIRAIYHFEMARTFRTLWESIAAPVLTTSLYFIVFGKAIGSRMGDIDNVSYGAFIIPGLVMLNLLNESISNASFGIYMPKWAGTIYELLSAHVSWVEVLMGYVGAASTKSVILGLLILGTARIFVPYEIAHPMWMIAFLLLTAVTFSLFGFIIGLWADSFQKLQVVPMLIVTPLTFLGARFIDQYVAPIVAEDHPVQSGGVFDQRLSLELLRRCPCAYCHEYWHDVWLSHHLPDFCMVGV